MDPYKFICLSVDCGEVCAVTDCGDGLFSRTGCSVLAFVKEADFSAFASVRVAPSLYTAKLVAALAGVGAKVMLAPSSYAVPGNPAAELAWLRQPPGWGGVWRLLNLPIAYGYALADAVEAGNAYAGLETNHPAWAAVSFPGELETAARFLADVVDPWWYVHPTRPGRWSRLYSFLGLRPANVVGFLSGRPPRSQADRRLATLLHLAFRCPGTGSGDSIGSVLRGGRQFVDFVLRVWFSGVGGPEWTPLDPTRLLVDKRAALAFQAHCGRLLAAE